MAEYVPYSPISIASSGPPTPQFVEEEDVLFPYWELAEENFRRKERVERDELLSYEH